MVGKYSFQHQYSSMYNIVRKKSDTVAKVLSATPLNISFRTYLAGNKLVLWNNLVRRIALI
jgi:hypothetical protein